MEAAFLAALESELAEKSKLVEESELTEKSKPVEDVPFGMYVWEGNP